MSDITLYATMFIPEASPRPTPRRDAARVDDNCKTGTNDIPKEHATISHDITFYLLLSSRSSIGVEFSQMPRVDSS